MKYPWLSYCSFRALRIDLQTLSAARNAHLCILFDYSFAATWFGEITILREPRQFDMNDYCNTIVLR